MKSSIINLLICTDEKYVPYYGIMLTSLFENNKEEFFEIYILTDGLCEDSKNKYKQLVSKYKAKLHIISINQKMMEKCPIRENDHVTLAAYYRIIAPMYLPEEIEKILYIDGDTIINDSIKDMWNTDINNYAMGAIVDEAYKNEEPYIRLGYEKSFPSINSGVLLINLKYWKEHNVIERCMECIETIPDKLLFHDQDTLNIVLHHEIKLLPLTYNFQRGFIDYAFYNQMDCKYQEEINGIKYTPTVIHYTGHSKPWHKGCRHPYTSYFLYFWRKSLWHGMPLVEDKQSLMQKFINIRNIIIWALGIKKRPKTYIIENQIKK